jgi:hypothetical protein
MIATTSETADPALDARTARSTHRRRRVGPRLSSGSSSRRREPTSERGLYRYTAFGQLYPADATTPEPAIMQPLMWKGRWFSPLAGGIYDVRARQWSPTLGAFLLVDLFELHRADSTPWSWPSESPIRFRDLTGRDPTYLQCQAMATAALQACEQSCSGLLNAVCNYFTGSQDACNTSCDNEYLYQEQACNLTQSPNPRNQYPTGPLRGPCWQGNCYAQP